jgi:hypothetical protein
VGPGRPRNSRPKLITALREALDEDETLERLRRVAIERMEAGDPARCWGSWTQERISSVAARREA